MEIKLTKPGNNHVGKHEQITLEGVRALKTGRFSETIEIFPFTTWKVKGIEDNEFAQLGREFQCNRVPGISLMQI